MSDDRVLTYIWLGAFLLWTVGTLVSVGQPLLTMMWTLLVMMTVGWLGSLYRSFWEPIRLRRYNRRELRRWHLEAAALRQATTSNHNPYRRYH